MKSQLCWVLFVLSVLLIAPGFGPSQQQESSHSVYGNRNPEEGRAFKATIDPKVKPVQATIPGRRGGPARRLSAVIDGGKRLVQSFVADEIIFKPRNEQEKLQLLARYHGTVADEGKIPPLPSDAESLRMPATAASHYPTAPIRKSTGLLTIKVDLDRAPVERFATNAEKLRAGGTFRFSSDAATRLAAIIAEERVRGLQVGTNPVLSPATVKRPCVFKNTYEHPAANVTAPDLAQPNLGYRNGFEMPWMSDPQIQVSAAWQYLTSMGFDHEVVLVAVIDVGGFYPNADFRAHVTQYDFVDDEHHAVDKPSAVGDYCCHGTGSYSVLGALPNNRFGAIGTGGQIVVPMFFRVSTLGEDADAVATAVEWQRRLGHPAVINMSFGAGCGFWCWDGGFDEELEAAANQGIIPIASAGNDGVDVEEEDISPCKWSGVLCVGAITKNSYGSMVNVSYSNFGSRVDVWAPTDVLTTPPPPQAWEWSRNPSRSDYPLFHFTGTSASAPFVSGIVAMMKAMGPWLTSKQIRDILRETGSVIQVAGADAFVVNAYKALLRAGAHRFSKLATRFSGRGPSLTGFGRWNETPDVGDFNGDCRDDVISFSPNGDVSVALSVGSAFVANSVWLKGFCTTGQVCVVGDFNGDGRDDVASIDQGFGSVSVALSNGSGFSKQSPPWSNGLSFQQGQEIRVGNFDYSVEQSLPPKDDLAVFVHDHPAIFPPGEAPGEVYVALSTGYGFAPRERWHKSFAPGRQRVATGDFGRIGYDGIVAFYMDCCPQPDWGDVWVAEGQLAEGGGTSISGFGQSEWWLDNFNSEGSVGTGDFDGNHTTDIVAFQKGETIVALSDAPARRAFRQPIAWGAICLAGELCAVGDFDGDGRSDIVSFSHDTVGTVHVSLAR